MKIYTLILSISLLPFPAFAGCAIGQAGGLLCALTQRSASEQAKIDSTKCLQLGFQPGTDAFANCRLNIMQMDTNKEIAERARRAAEDQADDNGRYSAKVYSPSECIGPVIMGECKGSILPNKSYHPTCHGQMLNGRCTGPMN